MKSNGGYLIIESILSISIIVILSTMLCSLILYSTTLKLNVEDKVELQQQASDISGHIKELIGKSKGIMSIQSRKKELAYGCDETVVDVISIKCKYRNDNELQSSTIKDKELNLKVDTNKLFINTLYNNGVSEPGGYEIGNYIDNVYISMSNQGRCANIKLALSKNKQYYETKFKIYIKDFEGEKLWEWYWLVLWLQGKQL